MKTTALVALALFPFTAGAITRSFTGNGVDANWSTTANWNPAGTPAAEDSLVFIAGATPSNNNLSGATFHDFDFNARHTLSGNAFTLTHGITSSVVQGVVINPNITLGLDQTFDVTTGTLTCVGALSLNGRALTVSGAGTLLLGNITGAGAASRIVMNGPGTLRISTLAVNAGGIALNDGTLDVPGIVSGGPVSINGGSLTGNGTLAAVTATGGEIAPSGGDLSVSGGLTLSAGE